MNADDFLELHEARPFTPFEIILPNSETVPVQHPEFMAFSPGYDTLHAYLARGGVRHIDGKLIAEVRENPQRGRRRAG